MARSKTAEAKYEAAGRRPGVQITIRLSERELAQIDKERGDAPRAAFVKAKLFERRPPKCTYPP